MEKDKDDGPVTLNAPLQLHCSVDKWVTTPLGMLRKMLGFVDPIANLHTKEEV